MTFSLDIWRVGLKGRLDDVGAWLRQQWREDVPQAVYAALTGLTLLPLVDACQSGEMWPVMMTLGSIVSGVGGNLLAEQLQRWHDRAVPVTEDEVMAWATAQTAVSANREDFDTLLQRLETISLVQAQLTETDQAWFRQRLLAELSQLDNLSRFQATLNGQGAVVQGPDATATNQPIEGSLITGRVEVGGHLVGRDQTVNVMVIAEQVAGDFLRNLEKPRPDLAQATSRYLAAVAARYMYLDFKGMGVSDRVPLRLPLAEMYVPLKARVEMPYGETWERLKVAGRQLREADVAVLGQRVTAPQPLLPLLQQRHGLIILGDPGAGKTTFLKYVALKLALGQGEALGLPQRLPILLPLSAYANALTEGDISLPHFISRYYEALGVAEPLLEMLTVALDQGGGMLLLDGLDEVQQVGQRNLVVDRVLDFFAYRQQQGNKFVLTSRIVGYREVRPSSTAMAECTLVDFDDEAIELFVNKWTAAIEQQATDDPYLAQQTAVQEQRELMTALSHNPGVRRLAANPLLLTILAVMKRQGVVLPERRVELYQRYVETLLKHWNVARGLGRPPQHDLDVVETIRVLAPLAWWMHESSPGVGLVKREAVRRQLETIYKARALGDPVSLARQLLADARHYANLLLERGPGQYGFIHLTFQEYLAAVGIAQQGQEEISEIVTILGQHVGDDSWHEVTLLTIGYLGLIQQREQAATTVLRQLIERAPGEPGQAAVLAGEAVCDVWPSGVSQAGRTQVVQVLLATMANVAQVEAKQRVAAGRVLARLGDPRPEVMTVEGMQFCYVPAGPFIMGSEEISDDEKPVHQVDIPYDYWLGRLPVTHAQYALFVRDSGGKEPRDYGAPFNVANHPVVGIDWFQARDFCGWLTQRWYEADLLPADWIVTLPSEAEWEKGAKGGVKVVERPLVVTAGTWPVPQPQLVPNLMPERLFPWGGEIDTKWANYDKYIETTSAMGCYPHNVSPYGCVEMAGNVWEWTRSIYQPYLYESDDGREDVAKVEDDTLMVFRGSAYHSKDDVLRCAYRLRFYAYHWDNYLGFRLCARRAAV